MNTALLLTDYQRDQILSSCNEIESSLATLRHFYPGVADSCGILIGTVKSDLNGVQSGYFEFPTVDSASRSPVWRNTDAQQSIDEASEHQGCKPEGL